MLIYTAEEMLDWIQERSRDIHLNNRKQTGFAAHKASFKNNNDFVE